MDQVLTDFEKAYYDLTGIKISGHKNNSPSFWKPLDDAGLPFWENIGWMSDGKELWNYIKKYNPTILSAPSKRNESRIGKIKWVNRELGDFKVILRSSEHKKDLAVPKAILIDDREDTIAGWEENGGIGIHHTNTKNTIEKLKELGL